MQLLQQKFIMDPHKKNSKIFKRREKKIFQSAIICSLICKYRLIRVLIGQNANKIIKLKEKLYGKKERKKKYFITSEKNSYVSRHRKIM